MLVLYCINIKNEIRKFHLFLLRHFLFAVTINIISNHFYYFYWKINWDSRRSERLNLPLKVHVSVDGTDCKIEEPSHFDSKWYSHKFNGPGVRYEIGLSILSGDLMWVNGPFCCGKYPDIRIFKKDMFRSLDNNEYIVGDNGYKHGRVITPDSVADDFFEIHAWIRARHETINKRLKQFAVLKHVFRHNLEKHMICFHAVCQLTSLALEDSPLFNL